MKRILLLLCGLGLVPAHASPLLGTWQYDGFTYEGRPYPNPNPNLFLTFTFTDAGSRLYWRRLNEPGFCERIAEYQVNGNTLYQKVTWVNPDNNSDCGRDPDMLLGSETETPFQTDGDELLLLFEVRGQPFIYRLKHIGCVID